MKSGMHHAGRTTGRKILRRGDDGFFLGAGRCRNCDRDDRVALKTQRGDFFLLCDCGTNGPLHARVAAAVREWTKVQATPGGKFV